MKDSLNRQAEELLHVSTNQHNLNSYGADEALMSSCKEFDDSLSIHKSGETASNLGEKASVVDAKAKEDGEGKLHSSLPRSEYEQRTEGESRDSDSCYRGGTETRTSYSDSSLHDLLTSLASLVGVNENDSTEVSNPKVDALHHVEKGSGASQEKDSDEQTADFQWIYDTFADVFVPNDNSATGDDKEELDLTSSTTPGSQNAITDPSAPIEAEPMEENSSATSLSSYRVSHYLNSQHVGDSSSEDDGYLQISPLDTQSMYDGWTLYSSLYTIVESANESSTDDEGQSSSSCASRVTSTLNSNGSSIGFDFAKNPSFMGYSHPSTDDHSQELTEQEILNSWEISLNQDHIGTDQIIEMTSYNGVRNNLTSTVATDYGLGYGACGECQHVDDSEGGEPVFDPQEWVGAACEKNKNQVFGTLEGSHDVEFFESPDLDGKATPHLDTESNAK